MLNQADKEKVAKRLYEMSMQGVPMWNAEQKHLRTSFMDQVDRFVAALNAEGFDVCQKKDDEPAPKKPEPVVESSVSKSIFGDEKKQDDDKGKK